MDERQAASIESQTMKVEQTEKDIKITVTTKSTQGGMAGNRRRVDLGNAKNNYTLDGKEVISERESKIGQLLIKNLGEIEDGKLKIQTSQTFNQGAATITINEVWTLSDANTLIGKRET